MTVRELRARLARCSPTAIVLVDRYSDYATPSSIQQGHALPVNGGEWYEKHKDAARTDAQDVEIVYVGWR